MSLLAPWFLLGLAVIGLPLWLHRLQTQNPKRAPISSVLLLDPTERRLQVQKRLRFLLLLALRILFLALLAAAFAQPLWQLASGSSLLRSSRQHLVFIDTSLSMSTQGRMAAARQAADRLIAELPAGDRAQLIAAGATLELQAAGGSGPTGDKALLRRALQRIEAGTGRLEYAQAIAAIDTLAGADDRPVVAHLVSDFQSSGLTPRFADLLPRSERGRAIELLLHPIAAPPEPNWSVTAVRQNGTALDVQVQGRNTPDAELVVALSLNDTPRGEMRQRVAANGEASFRFADVVLNNGENRIVAALRPQDRLAGDDQFHAVLRGGGPESVPLLTANPRGTSATYIGAALAVSGERYRATPVRPDQFDARTLSRYRWLIVDDLGALDATLLASLQEYLGDGGALLAAVSQRSTNLTTLPLGGQAVTGVTQRNADPLGVGNVDRTHPVLADLSGWQNLAVARMLKITPAAADRVLIATQDGAPLLLEHRVGNGRLLLLATSLDNDWSDLPVQPVFVSFMAEVAQLLAGDSAATATRVVGSTLLLAADSNGASQVIDPDGRELLSLSATRTAQSVRLQRSGFFQMVTPAATTLLAVNTDPRESLLVSADADTLAQWRQAAAAQTVASTAGSAQSERRELPLAPWLLLLVALVVIAESLTGNWLLRRSTRVLT